MPQMAVDSNGNKIRWDESKKTWVQVEKAVNDKGNEVEFDGSAWRPTYGAKKPAQAEKKEKPPWYDNYLGLIRPLLAGAQSGMSGTMKGLIKAADFVSDKLGIPKSDAARMIARDLDLYAEANRQRGVGGIPGKVAEGLGGAAVAIPELAILGPYGMAVHGGLQGAVEGGLPGAITGAVQGGLSQGVLKGTSGLSVPGRMGAGAAFGAATTPGGIEERVSGAATMAGLGVMGGKKQPGVVDLRPPAIEPIKQGHPIYRETIFYRGRSSSGKDFGEWWTTDKSKAEIWARIRARQTSGSPVVDLAILDIKNPFVTKKSINRIYDDLGEELSTRYDAIANPDGSEVMLFNKSSAKVMKSYGIAGASGKAAAIVKQTKDMPADMRAKISEGSINLAAPKITPMMEQNISVQRVASAIRGAKRLFPEQQRVYAQERGERMARFEEMKQEGGLRGEEAYKARRASQAGELTKVDFSSVRDKIKPQDIETIHQMIEESPLLSGFEKMSAGEGFKNLIGEKAMKIPQPKQMELLHRVLGSEFTGAVAKAVGKTPMELLIEGANTLRTGMSILDLSMGFRQGVFVAARNPKLFLDAVFRKQIKYAAKEKNYRGGMDALMSTENSPLYRKYGLDIIDIDTGMLMSEERMMGARPLEHLGELAGHIKIPGVREVATTLGKGYGAIVRASNRAYTGGLNVIRAGVFDRYVELYKRMGIDPFSNTPEVETLMTQTARTVNTMSGRGPVGGMGPDITAMLNATLFSPRLISSRLHLLNPVWYAKLPKGMRAETIKTALSFLGATITTIQLAKYASDKLGASEKVRLETDPRSSDFMKLRIGETRIDPWGGLQQYVVFLYRMLPVIGGTKSTKTGKVSKLGEGFPGTTRLDLSLRMFRSKLSPLPSAIWDAMQGENMIGEKVTVPGLVWERISPMVLQDIIDIVKDDPGVAQYLMGVASIFGAGVSTHGGKKDEVKKTIR